MSVIEVLANNIQFTCTILFVHFTETMLRNKIKCTEKVCQSHALRIISAKRKVLLPVRKSYHSKCAFFSLFHFGTKIWPPKLNSLLTGALDGRAVLYFRNNFSIVGNLLRHNGTRRISNKSPKICYLLLKKVICYSNFVTCNLLLPNTAYMLILFSYVLPVMVN